MAAAIRHYIARERMSREQFAFRTRLGKSTVDKLLTLNPGTEPTALRPGERIRIK